MQARAAVKRYGLTLLELLIAIALVLMLAAIALPAVMGGLAEHVFTSAAETTQHQLSLARAEAQLAARAIEVRYQPEANVVVASWFAPTVDDGGVDDDRAASRLGEAWSHRRLPKGVVLSRTPPDVVSTEFTTEADADATGWLRLAVYLPDGSALLGETLWLSDDDGRVGRLSVNPYTGRPRFERFEDAEDVAPAEDDMTPVAEEDPMLPERPPLPGDRGR